MKSEQNFNSNIQNNNKNLKKEKYLEYIEFKDELNKLIDNLVQPITYKEDTIDYKGLLSNLKLTVEIFIFSNGEKTSHDSKINFLPGETLTTKTESEIIEKNIEYQNPKKLTLFKSFSNINGGMFFHPREIIDKKILLTGGKNGIIKFWDIQSENFSEINEFDTNQQWITSIKYDSKYSHIYCSTFAKFFYILDYEIESNSISHVNTFELEGLSFSYGFDFLNNEDFSLLVMSGYSEFPESIYIYQNRSGKKVDFHLHQSIVPLANCDYIRKKCKENYSKSLKFLEKLNLLIIGLLNGIIEVYKVSKHTKFVDFVYHINLSMMDWVYQIQLIYRSEESSQNVILSNGNCLYHLSFTEDTYAIINKKEFLGSIHDFYFVSHDIKEEVSVSQTQFSREKSRIKEIVFIKLKTSLVIMYDLISKEILDHIDESKNKGIYDQCLIASKSRRLLFSCRDNNILVYRY